MLNSSSHLTAQSAGVLGFQICGASVNSVNGLCKCLIFGQRLFKKTHLYSREKQRSVNSK